MAVAFTSKFYQASAWKDISKIVYTSPNMTSPNVVGTRSHILPGQGDLGLWYEDTSNMYRIEIEQNTTSTNFYDYEITTITDIDLGLAAAVTVTGTEATYEVFYPYMKDSIGCTATGYTTLDMTAVVTETRVKLQYSNSEAIWSDRGYLPGIYTKDITDNRVIPGDVTQTLYGYSTNFDASDYYNKAWVVDQISNDLICYIDIDLDKPYKITKIYMSGHYAYDTSGSTYLSKRFFGNYTIQGKSDINDSWITLHTGANTSNLDTTIFLTSNDNFFKYYRINILNNTGLSGFVATYYALCGLQFYEYNYNNIPTRTKPLYHFRENGEADIFHVSNITSSSGTSYELTVDSVTTSYSGILYSGTNLYGWGSLRGLVDYQMNDSIVFEITVGEAYNCRLTAWDDVTHSTVLNELIANDHVRCSALAFCCMNSKEDPNESYDPINYVWGPVQNRVFKGNTVYMDQNLYYGDFDMVYRYQDTIYGDYLIFKPMLYNVTSELSYGVHDFIITLHYSYT